MGYIHSSESIAYCQRGAVESSYLFTYPPLLYCTGLDSFILFLSPCLFSMDVFLRSYLPRYSAHKAGRYSTSLHTPMSMSLTLSTIHAHTCPKLPRTGLPNEHDLPSQISLARKARSTDHTHREGGPSQPLRNEVVPKYTDRRPGAGGRGG